MRYLKLKIITTIFLTVLLFATSLNITVNADETPVDIELDNFNDDVSEWAGDADAIPTGEEYILYEEWGGTWYDVEKLPPSDGEGNPDDDPIGDDPPGFPEVTEPPLDPFEEDDLMCWAAACSNILQWTGWGYVEHPTEGVMTNADEMFQHYLDHWFDLGYRSDYGWHWWFDGTETSDGAYVDVAGGGNFWSTYYSFSDYSDTYDDPDSGVLTAIDGYLHNGWGVALSITWADLGGGHAITCWGINYDDSLDPTDEDYYIGIWITDSDDHKHLTSPPDMLRYYELEFDTTSERWFMLDLYGMDTAYIRRVYALAPMPIEVEKYFTHTDVDFNPYHYEPGPDGYMGTSDDILVYDPAELGTPLTEVDMIIKNGKVKSTNPGQLYGVITIEGPIHQFALKDYFDFEFDINPAKLCGGIEVIIVDPDGYAQVLTETPFITLHWLYNSDPSPLFDGWFLLEGSFPGPLAPGYKLMIYVKFQTSMKHQPYTGDDVFWNEAHLWFLDLVPPDPEMIVHADLQINY